MEDRTRIQAAGMELLRSVKGCSKTDKIRSKDIRKEMGILSLNGN
jgi:hypothetical protein